MKKHIINGHEMETLLIPKGYKSSVLWEKVQPYVNLQVYSASSVGECWAKYRENGDILVDTRIKGGMPLHNTKEKQVPYHGQEFILTIPVQYLNKKGLAAAREYEESKK
jgi:hypothetical protein